MNDHPGFMESVPSNHLDDLHRLSSDIKTIFIILVDISGYTRFIQYHKISLLHAEKIIGELMESILEQVEIPVMAHEILGDAISFFAIDENIPGQADKIYAQLQKYFMAFREREASLISECSYCVCDACKQVNKLRLKAILHYGEAAFTKVFDTRKISGEDVITSHRLLKNSIHAPEYILMTTSFVKRTNSLDTRKLFPHKERYTDIGTIELLVNIFDDIQIVPKNLTFLQKMKSVISLDRYAISRIFKKNNLKFRHLPT